MFITIHKRMGTALLISLVFLGALIEEAWTQTPISERIEAPARDLDEEGPGHGNLEPEFGMSQVCYTEFADKILAYHTDMPIVLLGGNHEEEILFDWTYDRLCPDDLPDMAAHAFRDHNGMVNLLATHHINVRMIGEDFNSLERDPAPVMYSPVDPYPHNYNDRLWLMAHWIVPETSVVYALAHVEYQGNQHPEVCGCTSGYFDCLWGSITWAVSFDGGQHFGYHTPPDHFVASAPYEYEPNVGAWIGTVSPSNIIKKDGFYYSAFKVTGNFPSGATYKDLNPGWSMMRTTNLEVASSWRGWDGENFTVKFIDPYRTTGYDPADHIPSIIGYNNLGVGGDTLLYSDYLGKYVTTNRLNKIRPTGPGVFEDYTMCIFSCSDDLIHWDPPSIFRINDPSLLAEVYPTFIDHESPSDNFERIGQTPHLYFSRVYGTHAWYDRDLIRMPVRMIKWEEAHSLLRDRGFDYYGVSLVNEPGVGNNLLQIIVTGISGIDFYDRLAQGNLEFDRKENRIGFYSDGLSGYVDPEVEVEKKLLHFPNKAEYLAFIEEGTIGPGVEYVKAEAAFDFKGGYGMFLKNSVPEHEKPILYRTFNGDLHCAARGLKDFDEDPVYPVMAFKKDGEYFAEVIYSFENANAELDTGSIKNYGGGREINEYLPHEVCGGSMLTHVPGCLGGAYYFDGYNFFHQQDGRGLEPESGRSMTIEFFISTDDLIGRMVLSNNDSMDDDGYVLDESFYYGILAMDGVLWFYFSPTGAAEDFSYIDTLRPDSTGKMHKNTFYHVAFVMDAESSLLKSYVNGELRKVYPYEPTLPVHLHKMENRLWIGSSNNKFLQYTSARFKGILDELRIYRHALTDEMIQAHSAGNYGFVSAKFANNGNWTCEVTPGDGRVTGRTKTSMEYTGSTNFAQVPPLCLPGSED